jgi:membrane-bound ClpP family serine protease
MAVGVSLVALAVILIVSNESTLSWIILVAIGSILFLIGIVLLIMELLETWMSRGQRALVDGLQAG